ncbi:hypothetical protein NDA11_006126 [Ustilago hordei]|nr:hypothetical protein NDA11_006126 [Ustilago hordei]
MPDKRELDACPTDQPRSKRLTQTVEGGRMSEGGSLAILKHPRLTGQGFSVPPLFQQPTRLCSFSFDEKRKLWQDDRCKRFYRGPPPYNNAHPQQSRARMAGNRRIFGADLNYGIEGFVQRDECVGEHLDALLAALQHRTTSTASGLESKERDQERRRADIVTWRGIITKICTAYDQKATARFNEAFELNAMILDGTLYLEEYVCASERAKKQEKERDPKMHRFSYYGYSFESYCTVETEAETKEAFGGVVAFPGSARRDPPGWSGDVNTNVQWCQVVKTKLGGNRLILGGEVDAVQRDQRTGREEMVELKTSKEMRCFPHDPQRGASDQEVFQGKLLKYFLQSYLLGIGKIVVGFRDPAGLLTRHEHFETLKLPRIVRAGEEIAGRFDNAGRAAVRQDSVWQPKDSLGFGDQILSFIRDTVLAHTTKRGAERSTGHPVFRVSFKAPFEEVQIRELSEEQVYQQAQDRGTSGERVAFLPKSFYDFVQSQASAHPHP